MTELVELEPRELVPSARQRAAGADTPLALPQSPSRPPRARAARRGLRSVLRDLDPRTVEGPRLVLLILCLTSLTARIDEQAIGVLLPQIRADLGVSVAFLGTVAAAAGVLLTLFTLPMGYLADRISRVRMVQAGTLLTASTIAATGVATSPGGLVGARLANGTAQAVATPASFPLMADYFPPRARARVFAIYFAAAQVGVILGPLLAGVVGDRFGWRSTLLLFGGLALAAGSLTFLLREPPRGAHDSATTEGTVLATQRLGFGEAYRSAATVATLRRFWYATPFVGVRGTFTYIVLPLFLSEVYQLSATQLGLVFTLNGITGLLALLAAGPLGAYLLQDRPGRFLTVLGFAPIVQAGVIVVVALRPGLAITIAVLQVLIVCEVIGQPGGYTLISLVVPARIRGLGLATNVPWQLLGLAVSALLVTAMAAVGFQYGVLLLVPLLVVGGIILITGAPGVEQDIRAARVADEAGAMARTSGRLLVCRDVGVSYGSVPVVFGVNLDVTAGEVVALLGTNGAGKSTLLRALTGVSPLSTGAIVFEGRDISALAAHERVRRGIITMPGGEAVLPSLSVADNLRAAGWDGSPTALDLFPALRSRLPQPAGLLSGGEQQMLGLAQALLMKPRLLLIDELSLGLAPEAIGPLLDVVRGLRDGGTAVVLVEQSLDVALAVADRAVFMERGEVRFDGPPAALVGRDDLVRSVLLAGAAGGTRAVRPASASPPDSTVAPAMDVRDVAVAYGGVQALDGASLTLVRGEIVGLLGANGAGKTSLFDVLSGFVPPDRGQVLLDGLDITTMAPQERARRGLVRSFQNARLFPALTVRECLAVAMERSTVRNPVLAALWAPVVRTSERRIAAKVDRLIDLLALAPYADRTVAELSTGTRRAVDIACVLALEPRVLLLDEPSAGLARPETEALEPLLRRLVRETGCALLVIEHDLSLVTSLADRLLSMSAGKVTPCRPVDA